MSQPGTLSSTTTTMTPAGTAEPDPTRASIAAEFRYFATRRAGSYAPLYARLAAAIAEDSVLVDLAAQARAGQSRPDLLLALIHDLLLRDPDHLAARFYPSLTATPADGDPAPAVLQLAHDHHDELAAEIARRLVQTNEVGRCSFLRPAIQAAALRAGAPLALLEVGASAGLNLLLDRYGYRYHRRDGETSPAVVVDERPGDPVLDCALDGPDHRTRAVRLDTALQVACSSRDRPVVYAGDAATRLPRLAAAAPPSTHLVIYHSAVAAHMPAAARQAFTETVLSCSTHRPISWVQAEPRTDRDPRRLRLTECHDGRAIAELALGSYQPHGQWLRWEDTPDPSTGPAIDGAATDGQPG